MPPTARLFVGREREVGQLRAYLADAIAGRGCLALLAGEPGIGKTRTAEELAAHAEAHGVAALWGRCWEQEGAPPFWPWVQVLRTGIRVCEPFVLKHHLGSAIGYVAHLVPEMRSWFPEVRSPSDLEANPGRFRLFDAVATVLKEIADHTPLLVILDDLHWADHASLLLLKFLANQIRGARVLILGLYRDVAVLHHDPLATTFNSLIAAGQFTELLGLTEADVSRLIESVTDRIPPPGLAAHVREMTGGNPFFAHELLRISSAVGLPEGSVGRHRPQAGLPRIPRPLREAIRQRIGKLSRGCRDALERMAGLGVEFEFRLLDAMFAGRNRPTSAPRDELTGWLDEAEEAGVLVRVECGASRYRFAHALVRETLYMGLRTADRARLHLEIGEALETVYSADLDPHLSELAYHFSRATPDEAGERAVDYAVRSGDRCLRLLAFEDAGDHYQSALHALETPRPARLRDPQETTALRCRLLLALGNALMRAGDRPKAREAYLRAADAARRAGDPLRLAHAALGYAGLGDVTAGVDPRVVGLLDEARERLGHRAETTRVRVLSRLASALYFSPARERSVALSQEALDLAREIGDPATLAYALSARHFALWDPAVSLQERLTTATQIVRLAEDTGKKDLALAGHVWRIIDLLELGDVAAVDAEIEAFACLAIESREAFQEWQAVSMRAMRAMMDGRLSEAEGLVGEAFALGQRSSSPNARFRLGTQMFWLRRLQGRLGELEAATRALSDRFPEIPVIRAGLALLYGETGDQRGARQELNRLAAHHFAGLPRDGTWLSSMAQLAEVCAALDDSDRAATLYERLLPYADRTVVVSFAYACDGALTRHLGRLATVLGRWEEAERHFADAIGRNSDMGARPLVALAQCAYADMLLRRRAAGDFDTAGEMVDAACGTFEDLGMASHRDRTRAQLNAEAVATATAADPRIPPGIANTVNQLRKEGESWLIDYAGSRTRLRDAKGLHYLAQLLREPGREFHVADLLRATSGDPRSSDTARQPRLTFSRLAKQAKVDLGIPDARAKEAYRGRLEDLRDTLEDAERCNDPERAARARAEMEFIATELGAAYGLHTSRKSTEPVEKLRKAVTNCIRDVLRKLQRQHQPVWRHLHTSIRTGTFCSYQPDRPVTWDVVD